VLVLADGLYEHIVFDGRCAPTIAAVEPGLKSRTLTVGGVAKSYAMMGWRIGHAGGPQPLVHAMTKIQSQTTSCASSISQAAACAALSGPQDLLAERAALLAARRDVFVTLLNSCEGLSCPVPDGTFYLFMSCAGLLGTLSPDGRRIESDRDFAAYLLDAADIVVLAGADCGLSPYVRVSFANPLETIEEAGRRIKQASRALHR
jgi:aspartate aminotransferase